MTPTFNTEFFIEQIRYPFPLLITPSVPTYVICYTNDKQLVHIQWITARVTTTLLYYSLTYYHISNEAEC